MDAKAGAKRKPVLLSDGGLWNNLATQVFEDELLEKDFALIVADASAPIGEVGHHRFQIPGIAEVVALLRQVMILNTNTVVPRRETYRDGIRLETIFPGDARFKARRLCAVSSCLDTPRDVAARFDAYLEDPFKDALPPMRPERREDIASRLRQLAAMPAMGNLQRLASVPDWTGDATSDPVSNFPTTLGKVPPDIALALVGRGYANTSVTLYLTRLTDDLAMPSGWLANAAGLHEELVEEVEFN